MTGAVPQLVAGMSVPNAKVVVVPDNANVTVMTPFGDYAAEGGAVIGLTAQDAKRCLLQLIFADGKECDKGEKAIKALELWGGGGYDVHTGICLIDGRVDPKQKHSLDDKVYHELGHAKQQQEGYDETNTTGILLEYHNIVVNENVLAGKTDAGVRTDYAGPQNPSPHAIALFAEESGLGEPSIAALERYLSNSKNDLVMAKDADALAALRKVLATDARYSGKADKIEKNLVGEYFTYWAKATGARKRKARSAERDKAWQDARGGEPMPSYVEPSRRARGVEFAEGDYPVWKLTDYTGVAGAVAAQAEQLLGPAARDRINKTQFVDAMDPSDMPPGYADPPAVTVWDDAAQCSKIYINHKLDDYYLFDSPDWTNQAIFDTGDWAKGVVRLDEDKLRATIVHELFHAASYTGADAKGLQGDGADMGGGGPRTSMDEAFTDVLAVKAYAAMFPGEVYKSGYQLPADQVDRGSDESADGLTGMWTGQLVDLVGDAFGIKFDDLKAAYLNPSDPAAKSVQAGLKAIDRKRFGEALDKKRAEQAFMVHGVVERKNVEHVVRLLGNQGKSPTAVAKLLEQCGTAKTNVSTSLKKISYEQAGLPPSNLIDKSMVVLTELGIARTVQERHDKSMLLRKLFTYLDGAVAETFAPRSGGPPGGPPPLSGGAAVTPEAAVKSVLLAFKNQGASEGDAKQRMEKLLVKIYGDIALAVSEDHQKNQRRVLGTVGAVVGAGTP